MKIDYYRILGVLSTASTEDITAAYHLLVRKCHPDTGAKDMASLATIRLANEAYAVLSDEVRRQAYDRDLQPSSAKASNDPSHRSRTQGETSDPPMQFVFDTAYDAELPVTPEEARYGGPCEFKLSLRKECAPCVGRGQRAGVWCNRCAGQGVTVDQHLVRVTLPAGVKNGSVIRGHCHNPTKSDCGGGYLALRITIQPCW